MKGVDIDLAAHFMIIREYGVVLWGEKIEEVFAPVPRENYLASICADVENAADVILEDPVYIILNLCRVLAFVKDGLYLSKEKGGQWGMERLPSEYHSVIEQALQCYTSEKDMVIEKEDAEFFAERLLQILKTDDMPVKE